MMMGVADFQPLRRGQKVEGGGIVGGRNVVNVGERIDRGSGTQRAFGQAKWELVIGSVCICLNIRPGQGGGTNP